MPTQNSSASTWCFHPCPIFSNSATSLVSSLCSSNNASEVVYPLWRSLIVVAAWIIRFFIIIAACYFLFQSLLVKRCARICDPQEKIASCSSKCWEIWEWEDSLISVSATVNDYYGPKIIQQRYWHHKCVKKCRC